MVRHLDVAGAAVTAMLPRAGRALLASASVVALAAHVGSPDVFFTGRAGPYDVRVMVRPPEVVPGVALVRVHASPEASRISIRPVYWRAGSRGAPAPDEMRRAAADTGAFTGSLWLMAHGAYSVDVIVDGAHGRAHVLVPVAAVATGRLALSPALGGVLAVLGVFLVAGLVNIVYKGAGESLVELGDRLDPARQQRARRIAAVAVPILALALLGGARWWRAVDRGYERTIYRPAPLALTSSGAALELRATDSIWQPGAAGTWRASPYVADHGKLMHLFLVHADGARAFAHLHPAAADSSPIPAFSVRVPPLPSGTYRVYGDVVHETGLERTLVGTVTIDSGAIAAARAGPRDLDDAWFAGRAASGRVVTLEDGATMALEVLPEAPGPIQAGGDVTFAVTVRESDGTPARLESYMGMAGHAVVVRDDGSVYAHLHPMGTVTMAAQQAFDARDRGDTTADGRLRLTAAMPHDVASSRVEFPWSFPRRGSYRLFVQVRHAGQVQTGAFLLTAADAPAVVR